MKAGSIIATYANYEGGIVGFSANSAEEFIGAKGQLAQEFAFSASESALTCSTTQGNLLVLAGTEEIIKLYNLRTKKSAGELAGEHETSITTVAATPKHVLSGAADGMIVIWRAADMEVIHKLVVKNVSPVKSLSMHNSQRMCLALYANGMLRLWNMLDARCIFKRKVGLEVDESEDEDASHNSENLVQTIASKYTNTPESVKWEPYSGQSYCVLFSKSLEIYNVDADTPLHKISFDTI